MAATRGLDTFEQKSCLRQLRKPKLLTMKRTLLSAGALLGICLMGYAQESTNAAGGDAFGVGGSSSYSVGQVAYMTNGANHTVAEGVQQPYEISQISGVNEQSLLKVQVFPNPTVDLLEIRMDQVQHNAVYQLFGTNGQLISEGDVNQHAQLSLKDQPSGAYLLTITENTSTRTFRIVKNQ